MLVATIVTYNDMPLVKDCIESIYDKVNRIIAIDGKYIDFPGDSNISTDGTLEYLSGLNKVETVIVTNLDEVAKRNLYLGFLDEGDICFNIDTDEVLIGNIPKLDTDIGIIMIGEQGDRKRHLRSIRFFKYRKGLHYWGKHTLILDSSDNLFGYEKRVGKNYTSKKITSFELLHNNHLRTKVRVLDKGKYYKILMAREAKIGTDFS
ncbi:hypothetical protein FJY90_03520 [Candidatus Gottesmanbacteria bacterium]|nr:hypothetical protein [Candidatus Gottesmanbacteria bacterium]